MNKKILSALLAVLLLLCCSCGKSNEAQPLCKFSASDSGAQLSPEDYALQISLNGNELSAEKVTDGYSFKLCEDGEVTGFIMYRDRVEVEFGFSYNKNMLEPEINISLTRDGQLHAVQLITAVENGQPVSKTAEASAPLKDGRLSLLN